MTMWFQVRAMLATQPSDELVRMKVVCKRHRSRYERRSQKERDDAEQMFALISEEQRRRARKMMLGPLA